MGRRKYSAFRANSAPAGPTEAAALLPQGVPVIRVLRTVFDTGDVLVEVQDTVAAAGRREFRSEVSLNGDGGPGPR